MIAVSAGRDVIVSMLLNKDVQINAINSTGQCSLHYAASKNRYKVKKHINYHWILRVILKSSH